jgi:hypothetical protein
MTTNTLASRQRTYLAVRQSRLLPGVPRNRVVLREEAAQHITADNPLGKILFYEGKVGVAYPTPAVKKAIAAGLLRDVTDEKATIDKNAIAPDSIAAILGDPKLIAALNNEGISTIQELVDAWGAGLVGSLAGMTAARVTKVRVALLTGGYISEAEAEL